MKISLEKLRQGVNARIVEAKKKSKKKKEKPEPQQAGYSYAKSLDFSSPLGTSNRLKRQGASNWGPMTSDGWVEGEAKDEAAVRLLVADTLAEAARRAPWTFLEAAFSSDVAPADSSWSLVAETHVNPKKSKRRLSRKKASVGRK